MLKKALFIVLAIMLSTKIVLSIEFDENYHVPNVIIVCFDASSIQTTTGNITIQKNLNDQVQIGLASFDSLAVMYDFKEITRLFYVKDKEWKDDTGAYPMNVFQNC